MSQKDFNWCAIHWRGMWRIYRDESAWAFKLPVVLNESLETAMLTLKQYLGCNYEWPNAIKVYMKPVEAENATTAYMQFLKEYQPTLYEELYD